MLGLLLAVPVLLAPQDPPTAKTSTAGDDRSCAVCHPGPADGLDHSPHAALRRQPERACTPCHTSTQAHVRSVLDATMPVVLPPQVDAAACSSCHAGRDLAPALAAHAWQRLTTPAAPATPAVAPLDVGASSIEWSAMIAAGHRFVTRHGSVDRYKTDLNLDRGFRLSEFELTATGHEHALLDSFRVYAEDIDDPYQRLGARIEKKAAYTGDARFQKTAVVYRAAGDFHRVDQKSQDTSFDASVHLAPDLQLFGSFSRASQDGYWLTNRIGNRNLTTQTTIAGVESPQRFDADTSEAGLTARAFDTDVTLALGYRDDHQRDRWFFARPSPINPAFPESEDFTSRSSLHGPQARLSLARSLGPLTIDSAARLLDLQRRIVGAGVAENFDTTDSVTTTDAFASGDARTWLVDTTATLEITDDLVLVLDGRLLDHEEELTIAQTDVTVFPSLGTMTSVRTDLAPRTAQRALEGSAQLDLRPHQSLDLSFGYGFEREQLRLPDLEAGDGDFLRGEIRNDGVLAGASWRPDAHWTVRGTLRDFGQNGVQLTELAEDRSRAASGEVRYRTRAWTLATFLKHRRRENDVSSTHYDSTTIGVSGSLQLDEHSDLHGSWTHVDLDSRTLTNFYFDPDPNPVPTFVGFDGDTQSFSTGVLLAPDERVRWRVDGAFTTTRGSFDVDVLDLRTEMTVRLFERSEVGVRVRWVDYEEAGRADDYDAVLTLVYWRQRL